MEHREPQHSILLQSDAQTPLGRLRLAGEIRNGGGVFPARPMRVYGSYAVVCILRGSGGYRDANGMSQRIAAGDIILVFPELAHWYGPERGQTWDELYVTFDGPAFDLWRQAGLLDASRPVLPCSGETGTPIEWAAQLRALLETARRPLSRQERTRQAGDFLRLLDTLLATHREQEGAARGTDDTAAVEALAQGQQHSWRAQACGLLETDLGKPLGLPEVAAALGVSYEGFRKRFQKEMGVSPARYRMTRRIEAARELLRYSPQMTNRQVAETLGFSDEYHFSRRFTQITGVTPRAFRRQ